MKNSIDKIILIALCVFILLGIFVAPFAVGDSNKKTIIHKVSKDQVLFLRNVDQKYQNEHGINIKLKKKLVSEMLGTEKKSMGEAWFSKGKMRLEITDPDPSQIIADGKYLWVINPPPKEFKEAKTQVLKAELDSKRARSQGLIQLLTQGGLLKYFKVVGVQDEGGSVIYFLQPETQSVEFKRSQIRIDKNKKEIIELHYWDKLDNETFYTFETTKFNQKFEDKLFNYKPPKDADIVTQ